MPCVVGIDIGGTTVKLALVRTGETHRILARQTIDTIASQAGEKIVARIAAAVKAMASEIGEKIDGAGIGCPGLIDHERGVVMTSANLKTLVDFRLADEMREQLGVESALQNDAKAAMLGEFEFGANKGCRNMVMLTLGTGVGGGVITGGKLLTGANNSATELGHVKIEFTNPAPCGCGKKGCIEAYLGINGIARIAREALAGHRGATTISADRISTKDLSACAQGGDVLAKQIFFTVGQYLGRGIANFIEIFNPEKVVLAGGASRATDLLMPGINDSLDRICSFPYTREQTKIEATSLPDDINVLGAAAVYLNR